MALVHEQSCKPGAAVRPSRMARSALAVGVASLGLLLAAGPNPGPRAVPPPGAAARIAFAQAPPPEPAPRPPARFPPLETAEAWKRLPPVDLGGEGPLPLWARILADPLPGTTAAMLEMDYLFRERAPLPAALRGRLRWAAARANRCPCSEAYALADLRRAGLTEADLCALLDGRENLPAAERAALAFARKLTCAASTATDEEVAELIRAYGERQTVALVLLLAYANFQDRLLLALDVRPEEGGGPPREVRFSRSPPASRRAPDAGTGGAPARKGKAESERLVLDLAGLREGLERQQARRARIALPQEGPGQINWGLVCRTYQPELAAAWSRCGHAYDTETDQDPIFNQSLFWVVTHSVGCFY